MDRNKNTGMFITLEGIEGVGKSTNIQYISEWLTVRKILHVTTREPGGTPFSEDIRSLLLGSQTEEVMPMTELLLVFASRAQHLEQLIKPSLVKGIWVLCDRFTDASYAYQGAGRGISDATIQSLESTIQQKMQPDLTIILDLPVADGLRRARGRSNPDRFEQEDISFFDRVRENYLLRAKSYSERCKVIDASKPLKDVQAQLNNILLDFTDDR
ncbi:MAG: dTMP kinase [Cellvibrionales bacterium TMED49]|nr:MAG: dTMP kinase [Cellvibrionales bacterium TMED49]OUU38909.1 MAG: dTMP kinase [Cellvibrionales bacterium TMED49]